MIKRCEKGHWYDTSVHRVCPHCKLESEKLGIRLNDVEEDDHTISIMEAEVSLGKELDSILNSRMGNHSGKNVLPEMGDMEGNDDKTISFGFFGMTEQKPVTGWLVCMTGKERGKDYHLHAGKNFVGRSPAMDVVMVDDKKIARDKHCSVIYDPKSDSFHVSAEGGNMVYLNDELLEITQTLEADDKITIGDTSFIFIPFSRGKRKWDEE